jgi:mercuric ion binding protein
MKKLILTIFALSSFSLMAEKIDIDVNGMVCSFCAQGITKKFNDEAAVKTVKVTLEKHHVFLETQSEISDERIKEIITDAGYSVSSIKRSK